MNDLLSAWCTVWLSHSRSRPLICTPVCLSVLRNYLRCVEDLQRIARRAYWPCKQVQRGYDRAARAKYLLTMAPALRAIMAVRSRLPPSTTITSGSLPLVDGCSELPEGGAVCQYRHNFNPETGRHCKQRDTNHFVIGRTDLLTASPTRASSFYYKQRHNDGYRDA
jgi:hypothetical protein